MVLSNNEEDILKLVQARDIAQAKYTKAREDATTQIKPFMLAAQEAKAALKAKLEE